MANVTVKCKKNFFGITIFREQINFKNFSPTPPMKDKSNRTSMSVQNNKNTWLKTNHSKQSATKVNCFE